MNYNDTTEENSFLSAQLYDKRDKLTLIEVIQENKIQQKFFKPYKT